VWGSPDPGEEGGGPKLPVPLVGRGEKGQKDSRPSHEAINPRDTRKRKQGVLKEKNK